MAETDITLTVGLDTKDADKTAKQLQKEVEDIFNSRSGQQSASLTSLELQMKQTSQKAQELRETLSRISSEKISTDQYQNLSKELEKANTYYDKLAQKSEAMSSFEDMWKNSAKQVQEAQEKVNAIRAELESLKTMPEGLTGVEQLQFDAQLFTQQYEYTSKLREAEEELEKVTKAHQKLDGQKRVWDNLQAETLRAAENVGVLEDEMEKLESSGQAFKIDTEAYNKTQAELDKINDKLKQQIIHHKEIEGKVNGTSKEMNKLANATNKTRKASGKMSSSLSKGLRNAMRMAKRAVIALGALFLGARGLMSIFTKLRSAILEGFKNLEQSNISKLKQQMEDLKNASTTMKNALIGAFEPIVTMIIPYIQRLVEWLTIAIDKMAQFIAAVSGQKTYIKAIKQVGNAAEKAGNQAKKALGPLDNLNVLTTPEGGGAGEMFEEVAVPTTMFDMLDKLKERLKAFKDIIDEYIVNPFKEGFKSALGDDWKDKVDNIKQDLKSIQKIVTEIMTDPKLQEANVNFLKDISYAGGQVAGAATRIGLNIGQNIVGGTEKYLSEHKQDIIDDTIEIIDLADQAIQDAGDLTQAVGEISDAIGSEEGQGLTASFLNLGETGTTELEKIILKLHLLSTEPAVKIIKDNVDGIRETLENLFAFLTPIVDTVTGIVSGILGIIGSGLDGIKALLDQITPYISYLFGDILEWWNDENGPGPWLTEIAVEVKDFYYNDLKPILDEIGELIKGLFEIIGTTLIPLWYTVILPIWNVFKGVIWPLLKAILTGLLLAIEELLIVVTKVVYSIVRIVRFLVDSVNKFIHGDIGGVIQGAIDLINDLKEAWGLCADKTDEILTKLENAFDTAFTNIGNFITSVIDKITEVASAVSNVLGPAVGLIGTGLSTAGTFASKIFGGFNIGGAASGAVIPPSMSEHLIKVGDNNVETEIISPLSTMKEAMVEALSQAGIGGNGTQQIVLQLDGKTFMTAMVNQNNEYKKMHGGQSAYA